MQAVAYPTSDVHAAGVTDAFVISPAGRGSNARRDARALVVTVGREACDAGAAQFRRHAFFSMFKNKLSLGTQLA